MFIVQELIDLYGVTVFVSPFVINFALLFKALITPAGDQLNLYRKSLGTAGKPPQYDS